MFLRDGICQSTKGDALPGYFVECVASNVAQAIYADANSTPIVSVSGVANRAKADVRGNYSYFVADGNYYEKYYDKQGVFQFQRGPFSMIGMDSVAEAAASAAAAAASAAASTNASNLTSGTVLAARMPALTGDVTTTVGTVATTIAGGAVTNAKLANVATATLKGRVTGGTGSPEDLTGTQATTLLDTFSSALKGLAPASGGGTTNFLRADGAWAAPPGGGGTTTNALTMNNGGAGAASGSTFDGSVARTISYNTVGATRAGAITSGDLSIATARLAGRTTAATGAVEEISVGSNLSLSAGTLNLATSPSITTPTVTGGTITPAATPTATDPGFIGLPQVSKTASYTLTMTDMFKEIYITGTTAAQTITIPANGSVAAPIGAFVTITNDSNQNWSIAITTDTLALSPGGTTGTRTLAANGTATIRKVTSTRWWIYGTGLT